METAINAPAEREGSRMIIRRWLKHAGHAVSCNEPVVELETDKVMLEVAAPAAGRLEIGLAEGAEIEPGQWLGRIVATSTPVSSAASAGHFTPPAEPAGDVPRTKARIPHDPARLRLAEHLHQSLNSAPHVTAIFDVDFGAVLAHRSSHSAHLRLTAYVAVAAAKAMQAVPQINGRWSTTDFEVFEDINIGFGVALDDGGLAVPVIHHAQQLPLPEMAARINELQQRARAGTLMPHDLRGGTFTISNYGMFGATLATPIVIHPSQVAILGVGALQKRVVACESSGEDSVQIRPRAYVSLTIDHRAIHGSQASVWLARFSQVLEQWPAEE
jgi:2-oxoglutarate dehydrogenase E2 component (dihydrolipoamide succinyltransferase)